MALKNSNEKMDDIIKIIKFPRESGLLIKVVSKKKVKVKQHNKKVDFFACYYVHYVLGY